MKIAFATIGDARDIKRGSGTPYYLWQELLRQGHTVHLIGSLNVKTPLLTRVFKKISSYYGKRYLSHRDPFMGYALGSEVGEILKKLDVDFILTNDYCLAGYIPTKKPVVLFTDDSFPKSYHENVHPWLDGLSSFSIFFCHATTAKGLKSARACFFASQYAADEAKKYISNRQFPVIPYGANIPDPGPRPARTMEAIRQKGQLDMLFIGKDWMLKGGDQAVKITRSLNNRGIKTHLHIVGVSLSKEYPDNYLTFHGLLNKDAVNDSARLEKLYTSCDVLLIPSRAEGYGLAYVEAAAFGMPSMAYATTGVQTAVKQDISGVLFSLSDDTDQFVDQIQKWFSEPESYESLSRTARDYYLQTANWRQAVSQLAQYVQPLLDQH